jgi:uncharacterized protein YbbC (DUF1343 family)
MNNATFKSFVGIWGKNMQLAFLLLFVLFQSRSFAIEFNNDIKVGAERFSKYVSLIEGKKVAVVANQTSICFGTHLVDTLLSQGVEIKRVFAPEHGFRGLADAGAYVSNSKDPKTGLKVYSLYGKNKKPSYLQMEDLDVVLFDLQDVGVRFYTYISTLHYMMEACAEYGVDLIVLDRPNPNGFYVDGPVLKEGFSSFVGLHPVSLVHGMTIGEYAQMINGEGWLNEGQECDLRVIGCENYTHKDYYELPVNPSPNLPNMASVWLYPSLGLFEGTVVSVGRGTDFPFQQFGHPGLKADHSFTPEARLGARAPKLEDEKCYGYDLREFGMLKMPEIKSLYLNWLKLSYDELKDKEEFFLKNNFINLLWGSDSLKQMILDGKKSDEIRSSWKDELEEFKETRRQYLLYEDFE